MFEGFKKFILRGNVVELAVGVMIGAAFAAVVTSLSKDIITPVIGAFGGTPDFSAMKLGPLLIGNFLNALIAFVIQAAIIYFAIVLPMNRLMAMVIHKDKPVPTLPTKQEVLLEEIRDLLKSGRPGDTGAAGARPF